MDDETNPGERVRMEPPKTGSDPESGLLTVSQAYDYLISKGLPRSKKTIRKWCRLGHVDKMENVVAGGAKWLITRKSLDARIAEERLIDASLMQETAANPSEQGRGEAGANPSVPSRDDALVAVLREQLAHERDARAAAEAKNRELLEMYHEISVASTRMGIEIGKGMQEQARARRLFSRSESGSSRSIEIAAESEVSAVARGEEASIEIKREREVDHDDVGNSSPSSDSQTV